ncbi:hypothetical protein BCR42DRAFT_208748 [Absidia repens]|uniref:Uncharacterized protein n=1 Tax=Absidia repens TaxID=90262 RepID=A0A1X2IQC2_9FUNG|nr:hypothetical protein BCR42DRAFT_208748 [Absidia repens]
MSFHLPVNKPRSLHRQLSAYTSPCTIQAPIPPSLEQSLDEWLSRTSSNNSVSSDVSNDLGLYGSSYSQYLAQSSISTSPTNITNSSEHQQQQQPVYPCLCCQLPQCTAWKKIIKVTCKLETETRLAAEVGQSLLQTNEIYKIESDKLKEQVKQCQEQKQALEISLNDAERLTRQLTHEKDKWKWKYEKSQKILDESAADLETANSKCTSLAKDIEQSRLELDKLQHLKLKSYQFVVSRKDNTVLESKYKKLTTQFETLSCAYQEMCKEASNKKFGKEFSKPLSSMALPSTTDIAHAGTDEVVEFFKELVSTNNGLESELLSTSTQLIDLRNEMNSLLEKSSQYNNTSQKNINGTRSNGLLLDKHISSLGKRAATTTNGLGRRTANGDGRSNDQKLTTARTKSATLNSKTRHRSASVRVSRSKSTRETRTPLSSTKDMTVSPQTTTSSPVVHHHYHYYTDTILSFW